MHKLQHRLAGLRENVRLANRQAEPACVAERLACARVDDGPGRQIEQRARELAADARRRALAQPGIEAFMREYDLSSSEGVLLMCIAEALLRIPDAETAERLIRDRLSRGHWDRHLGSSASLLVNASTWGLLLGGRLYRPDEAGQAGPEQQLKHLVARSSEPLVRLALQQAMRILAGQFVMGRTIDDALRRSRGGPPGLRYSYDCLGEAACTRADVERYFNAYLEAIRAVGRMQGAATGLHDRASVSVKLSALHPRYEFAQRQRVMAELGPRLAALAGEAAAAGIGLTVDAEEAERLELSLDLFEAVYRGLDHPQWDGFGLAVQAYQKRALPVLEWLQALAAGCGRRIPVRLVKGAYWDSEIKRAQERGLDSYPVFTRKAATDVSYLACARYLLDHGDALYARFASHNAYTLAWITTIAAGRTFELQRLHGMGEALYDSLFEHVDVPPPVRVYAPVGSHEVLLPYLVRRLLENGANSSFVNQLVHDDRPVEQLVTDPCRSVESVRCAPHPKIPLPRDLYAPGRVNSRGLDISDPDIVDGLLADIARACEAAWHAAPFINGEYRTGEPQAVVDPSDRRRVLGGCVAADEACVEQALAAAAAAAHDWDAAGAAQRADCLRRTADLFEAQMPALMARIVREGGRTLPDALAEVREAVDFCRYYAQRAEEEFGAPCRLPGPAGERNEMRLQGRGVFACISPWNFPLAIFTGQIAAALAAGNTVLAKPAGQTPLTAGLAVSLMHRAGVPAGVLHLLPGSGPAIGRRLFGDERLAGVAFTGSTETARVINRALAARRGAILPLVAETGGQNVMIADSTALPEQLVSDVLQSAFNSAGQRCSALRVLFVQDVIADRVVELLAGAMEELRLGDPQQLDTDVGPVIDARAVAALQAHVERLNGHARLIRRIEPAPELEHGSFFAVQAFELDSMALLDREVFGPILHVIRYAAGSLDAVIDAVNATGYGLTLGVHSRIEETWQRVRARARVGNLYINRNMIGAVVGVQPFGGEGLSGTGPKAGGPYYLHRFATERTCSVNTSAVGGDAGLLSLDG